MSDLRDVLYSEQELALLRALVEQDIVSVESDMSLFTSIYCTSGLTIHSMPEETWASDESFDTVGYSWVKRAIISTTPLYSGSPALSQVTRLGGRIRDVLILRTCVVMSGDLNRHGCPGLENNNLDNYSWILINPDLTERHAKNTRFTTVDIGFLIKTDSATISIATYDNYFSLEPLQLSAKDLSGMFALRHKAISILSRGVKDS